MRGVPVRCAPPHDHLLWRPTDTLQMTTLMTIGMSALAVPHCQKIIFHARFVRDGWDTVRHEGVEVRRLQAIPITGDEAALVADSVGEGTNIFLDRAGD